MMAGAYLLSADFGGAADIRSHCFGVVSPHVAEQARWLCSAR